MGVVRGSDTTHTTRHRHLGVVQALTNSYHTQVGAPFEPQHHHLLVDIQ